MAAKPERRYAIGDIEMDFAREGLELNDEARRLIGSLSSGPLRADDIKHVTSLVIVVVKLDREQRKSKALKALADAL